MSHRLLVALAAMVAIVGALPANASVDDNADRFIPRVEMTDTVFNVLSSALESYPFNKQLAPDAKEENAAALRLMKKLPWPDLRKLDLVRLYSVKQPDQYITTWRLPGNKWGGHLVLGPDFKAHLLRDSDADKTATAAYADELAALIHSFGKEPKPRPRAEGLYEAADFASYQDWYGISLLHHAYAAAYFGKPDDARRILHEALAKKAQCITKAYEEWAWRSFERGIWLLATGGSHEDVVSQWKETLRLYRESCYGDQLKEMLGELEKQVVEDDELDLTATPLPERLPIGQRIAYLLARLPRMSKNGDWWYDFKMFDAGQATVVGDSLVKVGRPAVPGLIDHLADRRLTRLIRGAAFDQHPTVLRCQDVALACIEKIVETQFYHPAEKQRLFSEETETVRTKVADEVRAWWKKYGDRPAAAGLTARLDATPVAERLDLLKKIELEQKKPVDDAVALLKQWAAEDRPQRLVLYVTTLAERGDLSLLPALRKRVGDAQVRDPEAEQCIAVLLEHGGPADYLFLRLAVQKDLARRSYMVLNTIWPPVYRMLLGSDKPLAVPLLVDFLDAREFYAEWMGRSDRRVGGDYGERCLDTLIRLTGYKETSGDSKGGSKTASLRFKSWWQREGQAQFLKTHPEVRPVFEDLSLQDIESAALPLLVDVVDAMPMAPVHYRVPRMDVRALARQGHVVFHRSPAGEFLFRFATPEAAAHWFAAARPLLPRNDAAAKARPALQELMVGVLREGKTLAATQDLTSHDPNLQAVAFHPEGVTLDARGSPWFWTELNGEPLAGLRQQVEEGAAGRFVCVTGGRVLRLDRKGHIWIMPSGPGQLLQEFDPGQHVWVEHPDPPGSPQPKDSGNDQSMKPGVVGSGYETRSGLLFFGDRRGVRWFDGRAWHFQSLYDRNMAENRYFSAVRAFGEPQFSEDLAGRVYAWSKWGILGRTGTIGFWVYENGKWKNVDVVERLSAVVPRGAEETWLVADDGAVSVIRSGRHIAGPEAQSLLHPQLRFERAQVMATGADGNVVLRLEGVTVLEPFVKEAYHGLAIPPDGPVIDMGRAAGSFLNRVRGFPLQIDPLGQIWGSGPNGLEMMSRDGRQITAFPMTSHLDFLTVRGAAANCVFLSGSRAWWRFDPERAAADPAAVAVLPAMVVGVRGRALPDALGRMWCVWEQDNSPVMRFEDGRWTWCSASGDHRYENFISAFCGKEGAMVFTDTVARFHLFDAQGHVVAQSANELATTNFERLRKALAYPPGPEIARYDHLFKDARDRIWWTRWKDRWGVVDSAKNLEGERFDLGMGPDRKRAFSVLCPLGDGAQILAADDQGAALLGVDGGRIVRNADVALKAAELPSRDWLSNTLRDSQGRLWVKTRSENGRSRLSLAIDEHGKVVASYPNWVMLEDRRKGLWFKVAASSGDYIVRVDADGTKASVVVPRLAESANFVEAADGTVWTLTTTDLVQIRVDGRRLAIAHRYPLAVFHSDNLWFDREDRLWMVHTAISTMGLPRTELLRFATGKEPVTCEEMPQPAKAGSRVVPSDDAGEFPTRQQERDLQPLLFSGFRGAGESERCLVLPTGEELYPWRHPAYVDQPAGKCALDYEPGALVFYLDAAASQVLEPGVPFASSWEPFAVYLLGKTGTNNSDKPLNFKRLDYRAPPVGKQSTANPGKK